MRLLDWSFFSSLEVFELLLRRTILSHPLVFTISCQASQSSFRNRNNVVMHQELSFSAVEASK